LGVIRGRIGAANGLPYLVGSGPIVAQSYADETLAYTTYKQWQLISLPILVWILGIVGELFVPTLPLNIPRREFGIYSWLALFYSQVCGLSRVPCVRVNQPTIDIQELRIEAADKLKKLTSLDKLEELFSGKQVKFVAEKGEI